MKVQIRVTGNDIKAAAGWNRLTIRCVLAREKAGGQRAVRDDADLLPFTKRQQLRFDLSGDEVVDRLYGFKPVEAMRYASFRFIIVPIRYARPMTSETAENTMSRGATAADAVAN